MLRFHLIFRADLIDLNIRARLCDHSIQTTRLCLSDKSHQKCLRSRIERVLRPMHRQPALALVPVWCTVKSEPFLETTGQSVWLSLYARNMLFRSISRRVVSNRAGISARWLARSYPALNTQYRLHNLIHVLRGLFHPAFKHLVQDPYGSRLLNDQNYECALNVPCCLAIRTPV